MRNIYSVLKEKIAAKESTLLEKSFRDITLSAQEAERKASVIEQLKQNAHNYVEKEFHKKPFVSIITVNRNGLENLQLLVPSMCKSQFYDNYEWLIVDNASSDTSISYLKKWQKKMPITIIPTNKKKGFSKAVNSAVKKARGEILVLLSGEAQVTDGWLDALLDVSQKEEKAGVIGGCVLYPEIDSNCSNAGKSFAVKHTGIGFEDRLIEEAYFLHPYHLGDGEELCKQGTERKERIAVSRQVMLIKRSLFEQLGGFDGRYHDGYEDVDFCLRAHNLGYHNYYAPECVIFDRAYEKKKTNETIKEVKRRRKNIKVFKCTWQSYLLREVLRDKLASKGLYTKKTLKVSMIQREDDERLQQLGEQLAANGYDVEYLKEGSLPYVVGIYTDVIIDGTNQLQKEQYTDTKDSVIIISQKQLKEYHVDEFLELVSKINEFIDPKGIDICGSMPNTEVIQNWGDYHYAIALAKSLEKLGYHCVVKTRDEWYERSTSIYTIVLRGKYACYPKVEHKYSIMWNISHPDRVKPEEYNCFDLVYAASEKIEEQLRKKIKVPIKTLMQCTDPEVMANVVEHSQKKYELLFVGNSRNVFRTILQDLLPTKHQLTVYGDGWAEFPVQEYVEEKYMPNEQVGQAYSDAKILLNDHWQDMKDNGIISNRIFDALAAGAFIISDDMPELHKYFQDCLVTYTDKEDLKEKIDYYLTHESERREIIGRGKDVVLENHTFDARAKEIYKDLNLIEEKRRKMHEKTGNNSCIQ